MMMKAILTVGISASGKTTWAEEFCSQNSGWLNINRDTIRGAIMEESGLTPNWRNWKWKWENKVNDRVDEQIAFAVNGSLNIIVSDTNLSPTFRDNLMRRLTDLGYDVELKIFHISYDEAVARDNLRANGVGASVIQKQYQQFLDQFDIRVGMDVSLPLAAIVDIDGTVALMEGIRGPFDWDKVDQDLPNLPIIAMVRGLAAEGYHILFTSGRDGCSYEKTRSWLGKEFGGLQELFDWCLLMRKAGDVRKDTIVKEEIFREHIFGNYNIGVVLDDRPSVCRMWRDLGLNVVQVGNPYVEF